MPSPAQHQIDALPEFVPFSHPCWDRARLSEELARHQELATQRCAEIDAIEDDTCKPADREKRKETVRASLEISSHPVLRYQRGATRFDLGAPGQVWMAEGDSFAAVEVHASDYMTRCEPMLFVLQRLSRQDYSTILRGLSPRLPVVAKSIALTSQAAAELALTDQILQRGAMEDAARLGVKEVRASGKTLRRWSQSSEDLDWLHDQSPKYLEEVASAVLSLTRPLDEDELFRSA